MQTPTDWACTDFPVGRLGLRPSLRAQTWPSAKVLRTQTSTDLAFGQVRGLRTPRTTDFCGLRALTRTPPKPAHTTDANKFANLCSFFERCLHQWAPRTRTAFCRPANVASPFVAICADPCRLGLHRPPLWTDLAFGQVLRTQTWPSAKSLGLRLLQTWSTPT